MAGHYLPTILETSIESPVSFPVSVTFWPAYFWRSSRFWLSIWKTLPLLTKTYLLPLLMHARVQSLSEARSAWAARIFAWLAPHALSEIFPVHVAPKQDVANKAAANASLEIIWNTPERLDRSKGKVCLPNGATSRAVWTRWQRAGVGRLQTWLDGAGKSPNEQVKKSACSTWCESISNPNRHQLAATTSLRYLNCRASADNSFRSPGRSRPATPYRA
jgi:hypothetical protein